MQNLLKIINAELKRLVKWLAANELSLNKLKIN